MNNQKLSSMLFLLTGWLVMALAVVPVSAQLTPESHPLASVKVQPRHKPVLHLSWENPFHYTNNPAGSQPTHIFPQSTLAAGAVLALFTEGAVAQTVPLMRERDRGGPICEQFKLEHDRLSQLLDKVRRDPVRREAILRTEAAIQGADLEVTQADQEVLKAMKDAALSELKDLASSLFRLESLVNQALAFAPPQYRSALHRAMATSNEMALENGKLQKAAEAGVRFGIEAPGSSLTQYATRLKDLLVDSGIYEQALSDSGKALAKEIGGLVGTLAFQAGLFSIDYSVATERKFNSVREREEAKQNLEGLRQSERTISSRLLELEQALNSSDCLQQARKQEQPRPQQDQTPPAIDKKGGSGAAKILVGTGLAAGAAAGAGYYYYLRQQQGKDGGNGPKCGDPCSRPAPFPATTAQLNDWCRTACNCSGGWDAAAQRCRP